jgi:hypothetical protein
MPPIKPDLADNRLLAALPHEDRRRVLAGCEPVERMFTDLLMEPGEGIRHVFNERGQNATIRKDSLHRR